MTAVVTMSCDGHRNEMPCRGALPVPHAGTAWSARDIAGQHGWRTRVGGDPMRLIDLCPSPGHTEESA